MRPFDALLFDFDGTIMDTESVEWMAWNAVFDDHGVALDRARWQRCIGTRDTFDPCAHLGELTGCPPDRDAVLARKRAEAERLVADLPLLPGVRPLVEAAHAAGLRLAIASSSSRGWVHRWLQHHDLARFFGCVRTFEDVVHTKPAPDLYLAAAAGLGVPPKRCLAIEDSANGLAAARAAGVTCVVVPGPLTADMDFRDAALRLESLAGVALHDLLGRVARTASVAA